ncbi:MAG: LacI family transcriptional regulator [Clostridiales bacterium]|nr:LacI family transcriptional regulator [Clostridiales bacterium]
MAKQEERHIDTIDDIARELGVSKTTVSRAISGKGRLSTATRAKVLAYIEAHNYRPNAVAKSLAQSKSYNLGLVLPVELMEGETAFSQACMSGICEEASARDYDVVLSMVSDQDTVQMERLISRRKVDGLIVSRSTVESPMVDLLKEQEFPFIVVGYTPDQTLLTVDNENRKACRDFTRQLLDRGLRRLMLLGGGESHYVTQERRIGFEEAHRQAGVPLSQAQMFHGVTDIETTRQALEAALAQGADCLVCMDDFICHLALILLRERQVSIPEDVSIVSFYDSRRLEYNTPPSPAYGLTPRRWGGGPVRCFWPRWRGRAPGARFCPAMRSDGGDPCAEPRKKLEQQAGKRRPAVGFF